MDSAPSDDSGAGRSGRLRFDRHELAGSFGDIGTDLPLIVAMIPAAGLDSASVFVMFGLMQVVTGLVYGLPMPMQPLKAMAVIVITQQLSGDVLYGGGLAIGVIMLGLTLTRGLDWLARVIPRCVVRGVQLGLGLKLASLALGTYVPSMGWRGYAIAAVSFALVLGLWRSRRFPAAIVVIGLGVVYALFFEIDVGAIAGGVGVALPEARIPTWEAVTMGFVALALPQIPLSLSNSLIATDQTIRDLFPDRSVPIRRIGLTYSLANLVNPFLSGIPVCHGCGGLAGHHAFGARTGGSVVIYGSMYLVIGLLFSGAADEVVRVFPQPVLGVVLLVEALALMALVRDVAGTSRDIVIALLVGVIALTLPQGFVIGLLVGTALAYLPERYTPTRSR